MKTLFAVLISFAFSVSAESPELRTDSLTLSRSGNREVLTLTAPVVTLGHLIFVCVTNADFAKLTNAYPTNVHTGKIVFTTSNPDIK
jgi:hypothetical protein